MPIVSIRTSSTTHSDALHQSSECLLIGERKHPNGGCEASEREVEGIRSSLLAFTKREL